jgi:NTP pyrophosphatase (non-canonical NTP hydrolase)
MDLSDFQREIQERYGEIDKASGSFFLLSVLLEECGELATAIRRQQATAAEEVADVVFCALSIANLLEVDVDHLLQEKYLRRRFDEVTRVDRLSDVKRVWHNPVHAPCQNSSKSHRLFAPLI